MGRQRSDGANIVLPLQILDNIMVPRYEVPEHTTTYYLHCGSLKMRCYDFVIDH